MNIALGKGDHDTGFVEFLVNGAVEFMDQYAFLFRRKPPAQQFEIELRLAEGPKAYPWMGR